MKKNALLLGFQIIIAFSITSIDANPFSKLRFHKTEETLAKITEIITHQQKGAYFRFGDGDVNLATGDNDAYQPANHKLMLEMREAFALQGPTILKTLPLYCKEFNGYEPGMSPGNHEAPYEWCLDILNKAKFLWNGDIEDVYSHAALHFASSHHPDLCIQFLKFLKQSNCSMFIGNTNIPQHMQELLFGKNCIFIPTPARQSYNAIDQIEKECLEKIDNTNEYKVIITAMGCSGRALQKRLWKQLDNVFLFDFGSVMDALCGWNTRAWIELTQFDEKTFIENLTREIKVVCTAALIHTDYESRKHEYIKTFDILNKYGYPNPYIVEAMTAGPITFLNNYSSDVIYSQVNNPRLRNKGVNEARSLAEACKQFNFKDNDIIIKTTGRYFFTSDEFLRTVENNPTVDAFVTTDRYGQVFTGCFALRYKFFKDMLNQLDYEKMEREMINIEQEVAQYLKKINQEQHAKIMYLNRINVAANIFGDGTKYDLQYW